MCLSPNTIDNPNFGKHGCLPFVNTTSQKLGVPCGHCAQCIANKQMQLAQRVLMESISNHLFYTTITYNDDMIPIYTTSTGYKIRFTDSHDLVCMFKRLRKSNSFGRPFRYFAVSELGSKRGRPHAHILWLIPKYDGDDFNTCLSLEKVLYDKVFAAWSRNVGSTRHPVYRPNFTFVRKYRSGRVHTTYDTHYCIPDISKNGIADVAFYVLKYMVKPSDRAVRLQRALHLNLPEDEYENIWPIVRPRYFASLGFGVNPEIRPDGSWILDAKIVDYLHSNLHLGFGSYDYPVFVNPNSGKFFPLSRYYRQFPEIFSVKDAFDIYYSFNGPEFRPLQSSDSKLKQIFDYYKRIDIVDELGAYNDLI